MKKLIPAMLGLALVVGSVAPAFAQEKKDESTTGTKSNKGKKKTKKTESTTKQ